MSVTTTSNLGQPFGNLSTISGLEPSAVWQAFARISDIPRASKNEAAIIRWITEQATQSGHETISDTCGNVLVRLKASPGKEQVSGVILQGHVDMVCEKNADVVHNFEKDPIRLVVDGDWLRADNTTLGADNGIAVAIMLALMHTTVPHGPIDLLFTIDEETGLTGALNLGENMLNFTRLINLDGEEEGSFYIGCAGGKETTGSLPLSFRDASSNYDNGVIALSGLKGGHSGADIHKQPGNAIKILARFLRAEAANLKLEISDFHGGDKHNAIPREAFCSVSFPRGQSSQIESALARWQSVFLEEYAPDEPAIALSLTVSPAGNTRPRVLSEDSKEALVRVLFALPHGVISMSRTMPGLVSTSTNLAAVRFEDGALKVLTSQRSDMQSQIENAAQLVGACFEANGAQSQFSRDYAAWTPRPDSALLAIVRDQYQRNFPEKKAFVGAIHAGLECGVIGARKPGMDMVSFGPDITGAHTPNERVNIASTARTWQFLLSLLEGL